MERLTYSTKEAAEALGLTSTLTDLQAKRQKVQDMMDDGFYDIGVPELKESDQDEDSR